MGLTSISTVLLVMSIQNTPAQEPKPPPLAVSYDRILTDYANGQFGVSVETLRKWHLTDIDEVFDGARADRRWTARLTRAAALTHTELGAALLRADHRSALGIWHFGVAEQAVQMRALAQDIEFRRDWYLRVLAQFRSRYLLTYTPTGVDAADWHAIEVELRTGAATYAEDAAVCAGQSRRTCDVRRATCHVLNVRRATC